MKFILLLASIIYLSLSNFYCLAKEAKSDEGILKVGLIVPLSGRHQEIGKSVLNSIRLALSKINNDQIEIFPKDNYSNPEKTLFAARQLESEGVRIVIGPVFHQNLIYLGEVQNLTFLSLSNKTTTIPRNVITMGINANSQINAIVDFIKKENLNKTIVLVPKSNFEDELRNALVKSKYEFMNIYSYDVKPDKLTSQIKQITAYDERKEKLEKIIEFVEKGIEILEKEEELKNLKKKYTLGEVDFDSVIIANFGENLKSVTNSFSFSDVTAQDVKFITLNQWFDETLLKESSANQIYFPSINLANYSKFKETYFKNYNKYPPQISILSYDILGLIYYINKVQGGDLKKNIFNKKSYVGEVGEFSFEDKTVTYKLDIYQVLDSQFLKIN